MSGDRKRKCLKCGHPNLYAMVVITKMVPLADRNGTIKVGGQKIGQADLKLAWDTIGGENGIEQKIRGPIICEACETEHYYLVGDKNPLRIGSTKEARELGYDKIKSA